MSQHTPGPWKFNGKSMAVYAPMPISSEDGRGYYSVANCGRDTTFDGIPLEERAANCRLIAAAPELLAACRRCLEGPGAVKHGALWDSDGKHPEWVLVMRAAIAKAMNGEAAGD